MSDRSTLEFLKGIIVGGAIGAVMALLYAPKSGKETREELGGKVDDLYSRARVEYEQSLDKARQTYETAVSRLKTLESDAKKKVSEVEGLVGDVIDKGKTKVDSNRGRLKNALDAAKNAYKDEKEQAEDSE